MRNLFNRVWSATAGFVVGLAIGSALIAPVMALVIPQQFSPRNFPTQQVHYMRFTVDFNDCVLVAGTCSVKHGAVPYNAYIIRASQQVTTAFNSGTTDTVAIGTASGGAQLVAAQSVHAGTAGLPLTVVAANLGIAATGNGITATGANGGFDIWATYAQTGAAPTAGTAVIIIEYIAPNDGACVFVPLAATSPAC